MNVGPHDPETGIAASARILHVSADFPDPIAPHKTQVIRNLLDLTCDRFDHRVISINRQRLGGLGSLLPRASAAATTFSAFEWGECAAYAAPGRGVFHRAHLLRLAETIAERMQGAPLPDLIVGHKLTVEGIVVEHVSQLTGVPYALTIQGNTDTKIIAARPDLVPTFRRIFHRARSVTLFAPWTLKAVEARLGKRSGPLTLMPCPTELDTPRPPRAGGNGLVSLFHLHAYREKNLAKMAEALRISAGRGDPQALSIHGGGTEADWTAARRAAGDAPGLTFAGPLGRDEVPGRLNAATALVLPSSRESFGLAFIEALFAGLPIIYPRDMAVSGWFEDCPFAIAVDARDPTALAEAMAFAVREEARLKDALAQWQGSASAERFTRASIARAYCAALDAGLAPLI